MGGPDGRDTVAADERASSRRVPGGAGEWSEGRPPSPAV